MRDKPARVTLKGRSIAKMRNPQTAAPLLIIGDEARARELAENFAGCNVEAVPSIEDAVAKLDSGAYGAVVIDPELLRILQAQRTPDCSGEPEAADPATAPAPETALHHALAESERRQAEIAAMLKGSRAILEYHEFKDTARQIFDSCKALVRATAGYVALLTKDGSENELVFLDSGGLQCKVDPSLPMPIRGLRAEAYRTGKPVYNNSFRESEFSGLLPPGHTHLKNVLFAPLVIEGEAVGLLGLANKAGGFTDDDARMAAAFGELAAIALLNSRTLESLEKSTERFRSVAETASDAIISIDSSGAIVYWNRAAEGIFGYSADEILGKPVALIMPERYRAPHRIGLERLASGGSPKLVGGTAELVGLRSDGSEFPLELSLASWNTREGIFFTSIVRDSTERKQAEEELRRSHDRTASILESITDAFFALDLEWRFTYINQEAERLLSRPREQLMGRNIWEVYADAVDSTFHREYNRAMSEQVPVAFEEYYAPLDCWFEVRAYPSQDGLSVYFQDITERKRADLVLRESYEHEHKIAETLQASFVPPVNLEIAGFSILGKYKAALKEAEVGGDFYDVFDVGDGRLGLVIGDVSGKGLQAALHTANAKYMLRAYAHENPDPSQVLRRLNDAMCCYSPNELFVTVFCGILEPDTRRLTYSVAGHDEPLLYKRELNQVMPLALIGRALGIEPGASYERDVLIFSPGDILLLYTDGVTDARKGTTCFGIRGLSEVFLANADSDGTRLIEAVFSAALRVSDGDLRDDAALLIVQSR
jgi:PAS domain S-box-containing protein